MSLQFMNSEFDRCILSTCIVKYCAVQEYEMNISLPPDRNAVHN